MNVLIQETYLIEKKTQNHWYKGTITPYFHANMWTLYFSVTRCMQIQMELLMPYLDLHATCDISRWRRMSGSKKNYVDSYSKRIRVWLVNIARFLLLGESFLLLGKMGTSKAGTRKNEVQAKLEPWRPSLMWSFFLKFLRLFLTIADQRGIWVNEFLCTWVSVYTLSEHVLCLWYATGVIWESCVLYCGQLTCVKCCLQCGDRDKDEFELKWLTAWLG